MTRCLVTISLLLLSFLTSPLCRSQETQVSEFRVEIEARGQQILGLCMMSETADRYVLGTIVNEFGMKVFDFSYDTKKTKIQNLFSPINKWYIRAVLRKDMTFFLSHFSLRENAQTRKRSIEFTNTGDIIIKNLKYRITYTFHPLKENS